MAITQSAEEFAKVNAEVKWKSYYDTDVRMSNLLDLVLGKADENREAVLQLTVVASGTVISGKDITEGAWTEAQAEALDEAAPDFADGLRTLQKAADEGAAMARSAAHEDAMTTLRLKMHLKDAKVVAGNKTVNMGFLRLDLKDVTAWTIGEMDLRN